MAPVSCIICQDIMENVHFYVDHVRVFHPDDAAELLDPRNVSELRGDPSEIRTRNLRLERAAS